MTQVQPSDAAGPSAPRGLAGLPARLDELTGRAERSKPLGSIGQKLGGWFDRFVHPGPVKDLLAGSWLRHPLHPLLTDVPIGAWTAAEALDLLGGPAHEASTNGLIGFGVLSSLPTAVTGLSELSDVTTSRDRALGALHALTNISASTLFALSYMAGRRGRTPFAKALSLTGFVALMGGGFLGGHLSYRRGIGVDQTAFDPRLRGWKDAIALAELDDGKPLCVRVETTDILLYKEGATIHAIANRCSHRSGPLDQGEVSGGNVRCPWHQSVFELATGDVVQGPATAPQPVFDVRVREDRVELRSRR